MKNVGKQPDITPLCSNATVQIITLIVCKIKTKWSGDGCRLLFQHGQNFQNECNSKFTLMKQNETAFLLLINLTQEDGGIGTCECSHVRGTDILHLQIIVKGKCLSFILLHLSHTCCLMIVLNLTLNM